MNEENGDQFAKFKQIPPSSFFLSVMLLQEWSHTAVVDFLTTLQGQGKGEAKTDNVKITIGSN